MSFSATWTFENQKPARGTLSFRIFYLSGCQDLIYSQGPCEDLGSVGRTLKVQRPYFAPRKGSSFTMGHCSSDHLKRPLFCTSKISAHCFSVVVDEHELALALDSQGGRKPVFLVSQGGISWPPVVSLRSQSPISSHRPARTGSGKIRQAHKFMSTSGHEMGLPVKHQTHRMKLTMKIYS